MHQLIHQLNPYLKTTLTFTRTNIDTTTPKNKTHANTTLDKLETHIQTLKKQNTLQPNLPTNFKNKIINTFNLKPNQIINQIKKFLKKEILNNSITIKLKTNNYINHLHTQIPSFLKNKIKTNKNTKK